jgi:cardiolipin synthase
VCYRVEFEGRKGMTTANKITIGRILLVPLFVVSALYYMAGQGELYRYLAVFAFGVAALSDGVDGYIARRFNQRSELGAILDPLADKLLLVSAIVLLSLHQDGNLPGLPLHLTVTVISRDILLLMGMLVLRYLRVAVTVMPHWTGKVATVFQMACVLWALLKIDLLLGLDWLGGVAFGATLFTGISGMFYVAAWVQQLSRHPASSPSRVEE